MADGDEEAEQQQQQKTRTGAEQAAALDRVTDHVRMLPACLINNATSRAPSPWPHSPPPPIAAPQPGVQVEERSLGEVDTSKVTLAMATLATQQKAQLEAQRAR
jgi:hypothetical protein